jgi:hypothetical protein
MAFWIFKCDPKKHRLSDRLSDPESTITWLVTQHKSEMAVGDTAFLMQTGRGRAIMRIDDPPAEMPELETEQTYWEQRDTENRCRVKGTLIDRVNLPIEESESCDDLKDLSIFHGFQQRTNFRISDEQGRVLLENAAK